jgi:hypothetical protein
MTALTVEARNLQLAAKTQGSNPPAGEQFKPVHILPPSTGVAGLEQVINVSLQHKR